jgi:aarF domain-containing kinase
MSHRTREALERRLRESPTIRSAYAVALGANVLGGYKLIDLRHRLRLGAGDREAARRRHHSRSARRLYQTVVRLRGLMIKIGQSIGSYPAAFPPEYVAKLSRLQDAVPPHPWEQMRPALEDALGRPLDTIFAVFDPRPVAAASLAQVYRATLHDGREVAVKVLYPGIERLVQTDLRLLRLLLWIDGRSLGYSLDPIYQELARSIPTEIDLLHEAEAMQQMAGQFRDDPRIVIPAVVHEHTRRTVLVMDWIDGIKVTQTDRLRAAGIDVQALSDLITDCYCRQMLVYGFFHADPHPGNLFGLPGNRLAIVDFGLTKRLNDRFRNALARVTRATFTYDTPELIEGYREMGYAVKYGDGADVYEATGALLRGLTDSSIYTAGADAMLALNAQWEKASRANPFNSMPGDATLVSRVLYLLTGVAAAMGAESHVLEVVLRYTDPTASGSADAAAVPAG